MKASMFSVKTQEKIAIIDVDSCEAILFSDKEYYSKLNLCTKDLSPNIFLKADKLLQSEADHPNIIS